MGPNIEAILEVKKSSNGKLWFLTQQDPPLECHREEHIPNPIGQQDITSGLM